MLMKVTLVAFGLIASALSLFAQSKAVPVTIDNFYRAESDMYYWLVGHCLRPTDSYRNQGHALREPLIADS
jgi:hypothetical protein